MLDYQTPALLDRLFRLDSKVAIVTGGYGGIGESVCRGLAAVGAKVVIAGRNSTRAEALAGARLRHAIAPTLAGRSARPHQQCGVAQNC